MVIPSLAQPCAVRPEPSGMRTGWNRTVAPGSATRSSPSPSISAAAPLKLLHLGVMTRPSTAWRSQRRADEGSGPDTRRADLARPAPMGGVLAGADAVGASGAGPVLRTALAGEPGRHPMAGSVEDPALLPPHRPGQRLASSSAVVRTQRIARSAGMRPGDCQHPVVSVCASTASLTRRSSFVLGRAFPGSPRDCPGRSNMDVGRPGPRARSPVHRLVCDRRVSGAAARSPSGPGEARTPCRQSAPGSGAPHRGSERASRSRPAATDRGACAASAAMSGVDATALYRSAAPSRVRLPYRGSSLKAWPVREVGSSSGPGPPCAPRAQRRPRGRGSRAVGSLAGSTRRMTSRTRRCFGGSNLAVHPAARHAVRVGACGALVGSPAGALPPPKTPTTFATQSSAGRGIATNTATEPGNTATNRRIHFMGSDSRFGGTTPPTNVHDMSREARDARRRRTTVLATDPHSPVATPAKCPRTRHAGSPALPVSHSSSLNLTAERNQTKGRSREIHWFGWMGLPLVRPISPMRCVLIVDNRRGWVGDRGWTTSWTRTHFATVGAQGSRVVEAPQLHGVSRDAIAELAEHAFVGVHGADSHVVDGPVVPFPIRTTQSCCLCERRRLPGPCHVPDSLP